MTDLDDRLRGDRLLPAWLLYIDCAPAVRLWTGPMKFKLAANGPDTAGGLYLGLGLMTQVPSLKLPVNGTAEDHVFGLSGVSAQIVRLIEADRDALRGARAFIARMELNPDGTVLGAPIWLWSGVVVSPRMQRDGSNGQVTYTISIMTSSGSTARKARQLTYYTGVQQRKRDGADTSCDNTAQYAAGTTVIWPGSA